MNTAASVTIAVMYLARGSGTGCSTGSSGCEVASGGGDLQRACNIVLMFSRRTSWNLEKNAFTLAIERQRRSGASVLDLTESNPTAAGLRLENDVLPSLFNAESLRYDPQPRGLPCAREAVVEYYRSMGVNVSAEQLVLTTSTSEAYSYVFRLLCDPGDEVLIPTPSYPLFEFLADIQDVRLVPYELVYDHGWQIDFHSLRTAVTPGSRAIILVNPNNPTGSYVKQREREELNRLCADREMALVVDEVFFDFNLTGERFETFAQNHAALTFTMSGLSKIAGLPQMKVAWLATSGPADLAGSAMDRLEVIADTYLSMNAPIQHAIPTMLGRRGEFQQELMARLRTNLAELDQQLSAQKLCSRLAVEGGWYATLRVPVTRTDEQLAIELLEERRVLVHPGHFFDFHSDGYLILSLMTPEKIFSDGLQRILSFVAETSA